MRNVGRTHLFRLNNDYFISRFGNVLSPIILSMAEFRQRYRGGDGLLREIVDTGRVIHGKLISERPGNVKLYLLNIWGGKGCTWA